jgi:hypothetical protein
MKNFNLVIKIKTGHGCRNISRKKNSIFLFETQSTYKSNLKYYICDQIAMVFRNLPKAGKHHRAASPRVPLKQFARVAPQVWKRKPLCTETSSLRYLALPRVTKNDRKLTTPKKFTPSSDCNGVESFHVFQLKRYDIWMVYEGPLRDGTVVVLRHDIARDVTWVKVLLLIVVVLTLNDCYLMRQRSTSWVHSGSSQDSGSSQNIRGSMLDLNHTGAVDILEQATPTLSENWTVVHY